MENTAWGHLEVELSDTDGDGNAFLTGNFGEDGSIQAVRVRNSTTFDAEYVGAPLGTEISSPGIYSFAVAPVAGPTWRQGDELVLTTNFILSPGDTAHIKSQFIIDEGTGVPFAEIPELPDPADGSYLNVIDVNSPETSLGDDWFIGSQTQLNLSEGGSIGERFNFHEFMNNQLNDNNFDVEVNITGGTVGNQFMALGGTTVNISGGAVEGNFLAGDFNGGSTDVEVSISGGTVGIGGGSIQAYAGSVVNISGGSVGRVAGNGGVVYLSGGTVDSLSSNTIEANPGSIVNISGGSFAGGFGTKGIAIAEDGIANIAGGSFTAGNWQFTANDGGIVNLFGTDFRLDGVALAGLEWGVPLTIAQRDVTLSGLLADGSPFSIDLNSVEDPLNPNDFVNPGALLTVTLALPGDFNNNGTVDAADYALWRDTLDSDNTLPNDTSPGMVTQHDYGTWRANFGKTRLAVGSAVNSNVPEPASVLFVAVGLLAAPTFLRRQIRP
jgi:hypothetical protein